MQALNAYNMVYKNAENVRALQNLISQLFTNTYFYFNIYNIIYLRFIYMPGLTHPHNLNMVVPDIENYQSYICPSLSASYPNPVSN